MYLYTGLLSGGSFNLKEAFINQISAEGNGVAINIQDHKVNGAELKVIGNSNGVTSNYTINAVELNGDSMASFSLTENSSKKFHWDSSITKWRQTI